MHTITPHPRLYIRAHPHLVNAKLAKEHPHLAENYDPGADSLILACEHTIAQNRGYRTRIFGIQLDLGIF